MAYETTPGSGGQDIVNNDQCSSSNQIIVVSDVNLPLEVESVRREVPRFAGIYIEGMLQGVEVNITVDTGATTSLVSVALYNRLRDNVRPTLKKPSVVTKITNADGQCLRHVGCAVFAFSLGSVQIEESLLVADIEDDMLLGSDVLQRDNEGPADLILSEGIMKFRGEIIPLQQIYSSSKFPTKRVRAADH